MEYSAGRRFTLSLHADFDQDLDDLWEKDEAAVLDIYVFLDEAEAHQEILDRFTARGDFTYGAFLPPDVANVVPIQQYKKTHNLWRLKFIDAGGSLGNYRVIYAFHPGEYRYYLLGLMPRQVNYDHSDPFFQRILKAYDQLGIPDY